MANDYKLNVCLFASLAVLSLVIEPCLSHALHYHDFLLNDYGKSFLPLSKFNNVPSPLVIAKELTPAEMMVDLTNDLSYRIVHYHSVLNRNNFAFSASALMSVLTALYEGSTGHSAAELKNNLLLPDNRDVIRIGYRDIHRRLRTYFFDADNPLKGLSMNKENITITRSFETLLTFYGYDLSVDMLQTLSMPILNSTETIPVIDVIPKTKTDFDNKRETPREEVMEEADQQASSMSTTAETTTIAINGKSTMIFTTTTTATTPEFRESLHPITTTENVKGNAAIKSRTDATILQETDIKTIEEATELFASPLITEMNSEPFARIQKAQVTRLPSGKLQAPLTSTIPKINYLPAQRKGKHPTTLRNKRQLFSLKDVHSNYFATLFHEHTHLSNNIPPIITTAPEYEAHIDPNFISSLGGKQNYNTDVISHVFYLNSHRTIYTTFKVYSAVLYYKYFTHLHMSAIELELDTSEYNLLIFLPDYHMDMVSAAASLRLAPKLRFLRKQLKPKWVQATIPDFKLHGAMFLTNDLQNMGILDIFEPNRADFRQMTAEKGVYVKHIEQSINIHIRTHPINQLRRTTGTQAQPIQISVNHPFIFFVVDRDLDIAVMAGRILNPLNVRIQ